MGKKADFNGSGLRCFRPVPLLITEALQQRAAGVVRGISENRFCFLNQTIAFGENIDWQAPNANQLWRYHLHYFNYVVDLIAWSRQCGATNTAAHLFSRIAHSWMDHNLEICGDAWHPYPLSLRIVNWLQALAAWSAYFNAHSNEADRIIAGIYGQVRYLSGALEKDVRGNHLLKNIKGLIWAGITCHDQLAGAWLTRGLNLLHQELDEQILADGGHFERAPGYHVDVLADLLNLAWLLRLNHAQGAPIWLESKLRKMLQYLAAILTPNYQLPLLKDTAYCDELEPATLLAAGAAFFNTDLPYEVKSCQSQSVNIDYVKFAAAAQDPAQTPQDPISNTRSPVAGTPHLKPEAYHLKHSGYVVFKNIPEKDHLIMDVGAACPDYLPAHAHADMLSFELTVSGRKIISDAGVYEYAAGPWRRYFRSTRAHNTVEVDGVNQSDVWSSFRVGRRARIISCKFKDMPSYAWAEASHDGYSRRMGAIHLRKLIYIKTGIWIVLDEVQSLRNVRAANYLHFSPDLQPVILQNGCRWRIDGTPVPVYITFFGGCSAAIETGWYSETFGTLEKAWGLKSELPPSTNAYFGCVISKYAPADCSWEDGNDKPISLGVTAGDLDYHINFESMRVSSQ